MAKNKDIQHKIIMDKTKNDRKYRKGLSLAELFEEQVWKHPEQTAIIYKNKSISYQKLNEEANQLAHHLRGLGMGSQSMVGVYLENSPEMFASILGILKAGGAYIPFDLNLPTEQIQHILSKLGVDGIISQGERVKTLENIQPNLPHKIELISLDNNKGNPLVLELLQRNHFWNSHHLQRHSQNNLSMSFSSSESACILYSFPEQKPPRGTILSHQSIHNLVDWSSWFFSLEKKDRILFVNKIWDILSIFDIFGILCTGGAIHLASEDQLKDPDSLAQLLIKEDITLWHSTPDSWEELSSSLIKKSSSSLRLGLLTQEFAFRTGLESFREIFPQARFFQMEGYAETTLWSGYSSEENYHHEITGFYAPRSKPIQNTEYYILDLEQKPCSIGDIGDLYIGGNPLSSGYLQDPGLTGEKFTPHPFEKKGLQLFKTGKKGCYQEKGEIILSTSNLS